ncbi:MAG: hypothetical protein KF762_04180 [Acidobacteria bacterium]|nr:hypothetical protein [Acidobacteriota bacterium]
MASKKSKSKKLSSTKERYRKQLEETVFFVDRSSGRYELSDGLRELGLNVERHDDHFAPDTIDPDWIAACAKKNWIIISSDLNIKRNLLERLAILNSNLGAFFFTSAQITSEEQIKLFQKAIPKIARILVTQPRPFIARINKQGEVELWLNHKGHDLIASKQLRKRLKN